MKKQLLLFPLLLLTFGALLSLAASHAPTAPAAATATVTPDIPADVAAILNKYGCMACHNMQRRMVGPTWPEIAAKGYSKKKIVELVYKPVPSNWPGYPPMAAQPTVPKADLNKVAAWLESVK